MLLLALAGCRAQAADRLQLRMDPSAAEAVLAIVEERRSGTVDESAWRRLFETAAYQRLRRRETEMGRPFSDSAFRAFVLSPELALRAGELRGTLRRWESADLAATARRILGYLPPEARIRATVYPMIKPQPNSFVFEARSNPAIFLYLDPALSTARFENTVAHELHHIGFASIAARTDSLAAGLPDNVRTAVAWMGAFGEGFAMLAAAGGPGNDPHAASSAEERTRWERDLANFNPDLRRLDAFFLDVIDGRTGSEEETSRRAFSFFGEQGPWYTVGYRMAVIVERRYGRPTVIDCMTDPRRLLARYNAAAAELNEAGGEGLALWSPRLLSAIGAP